MTQTILLAPTTAATTSDPFTVEEGKKVTIGAFATDSDDPTNGEITSQFRAHLERQYGTRWKRVARSHLDIVRGDYDVTGYGVFQIVKEASAEAVGFAKDDGVPA